MTNSANECLPSFMYMPRLSKFRIATDAKDMEQVFPNAFADFCFFEQGFPELTLSELKVQTFIASSVFGSFSFLQTLTRFALFLSVLSVFLKDRRDWRWSPC